MLRSLACAAGFVGLALVAVLAVPSPAAAQYYNQGFNGGFSGADYGSSGGGYYNAPAYNYAAPAGQSGQESAMIAGPVKRAYVTIHAPKGATVWFAGVKATKKSEEHKFRVGPISTRQTAGYSVVARWTTKEGKQVERVKTVNLRGGEHTKVSFGSES